MISKIARIAAGTTLAAGIVGVIAATAPAAGSAIDSAAFAASSQDAAASIHLGGKGPTASSPTIRVVNVHGHLAIRGTGFAPGGYDYITMISPQLDPGGTYFTAGAKANASGTVTITTPFLFHCAPGSPTGTVGATDSGVYKSSNEVQVTICKRPASNDA